MKIILQCKTCGQPFQVSPYRQFTVKFCSNRCRGKSAQKQFTGICEICNKAFNYIACREGKAKYCSRQCYYKAQHLKGTIIQRCLFCQKEFRTSPSHKRKYCSRLCKNEAMKKTKTGGFRYVRDALHRRGLVTKCVECGYSTHPEILGIHHSDKSKQNNSLANLLVLCPNCHSLKHKKHIPH